MTTVDRTYNGYTNYETWAVHTWLSNEQATYEYWRAGARAVFRELNRNSQDARIALAENLKAWYEEDAPDLGASVWADLLGAALSEVDWFDIADSLLADFDGYEARD